MIRAIFVFTALIIAALGASWLAERPGELKLQWLDYQIESSAAFLLIALIVFAILLWLILKLLISALNLPKNMKLSQKLRQQELGMDAMTHAFIALGEKDQKRAKLHLNKAERYLSNPAMPRLLMLQALRQEENAENRSQNLSTHFKLLQSAEQTRPIALRGLIEEARRYGKMQEALNHAELLVDLRPNNRSSLLCAIDLYSYHRRWQEALQLVSKAKKRKLITADEALHSSAIIYHEQAEASLAEGNRNAAIALYKSALSKEPGFTPSAQALAEIYIQTDQNNLAIKLIRKAWKYQPHPFLAKIHQTAYPDLSTEKKLKKAQDLAKNNPQAQESQMVIARAAIDAEKWDIARNHLKIALSHQETVEACRLMAKLSAAEKKDERQEKEWLERASIAIPSPNWRCENCGNEPLSWEAHCGECQQFDTIRWKPKQYAALQG